MEKQPLDTSLDRRAFLRSTGALVLGASLVGRASRSLAADVPAPALSSPSGKALRGLYPILQTPFTPENKLDGEALAGEVRFCNRGRLGGMIWPVFASSWSTLSDAERIEGAETILAAGAGGEAAIAIAVQNNAWDPAVSVRYAKHAAAHGADALVAIPPNNGWNVSDQAVVDYYRTIGSATDLPLIVQTRGTVSVDLLVRISQEVPTVRATKDEVGDPLKRIPEILRRTKGKLAVWAAGGGTGNLLLEELPPGFAGLCPTPQYSDLLQQVMELYWAGKKGEAFDMFGRVQGFAAIAGATEYLMVAREVFQETTTFRPQPMEPEARPAGAGRRGAGGLRDTEPASAAQKAFIRQALETYLRPYLRA
ncbi:MAG TPA: dihydrodipicolinate synthase family protein [Opitutaceae bacterium]|jgi:4-hydroxy-tetrahydrodipicolinate synthase|nr:dihydrodipicolinate synthase family protein [Opitutaceae bacterium]